MSNPARPARSQSMLRIFLSSTSVDLKAYRAAVRRVIETFDEHPVVMDDFGAHDGDATSVSLEKLRSCDLYVLLLAWRYGTIPTNETLSVTHQEYRAARDAGMPLLVFLADEATERDDGPDALFPAAVRDTEHIAQVREFRAEVGGDRVAAFFTTPESVALAVAAALHQLIPTLKPQGPRPPRKLAPRALEFVGRTTELAELCDRLWSGQSVGLSALISGLGGVGKSALAAEALATLAMEPDAFPGGVTWARCDGREGSAGLTWLYDQLLADWDAPLSPEQLAQAQTLGPEAEVELRERALQARLRDATSALALLDNVEVETQLIAEDFLDGANVAINLHVDEVQRRVILKCARSPRAHSTPRTARWLAAKAAPMGCAAKPACAGSRQHSNHSRQTLAPGLAAGLQPAARYPQTTRARATSPHLPIHAQRASPSSSGLLSPLKLGITRTP